MNLGNIIEGIKANKGSIIKKTLVIGGAVAAAALGAKAIMKPRGYMESTDYEPEEVEEETEDNIIEFDKDSFIEKEE